MMLQEDHRTNTDRRRQTWPVLVDRRVRELDRRRRANHSVAVGPVAYRHGWVQGRCSCGSEISARVPGVVEQWAIWHLDEAAARQLSRSA